VRRRSSFDFEPFMKSNGGKAMQNWKKNRNYRKHKNDDGTFTYTITVDGVNVAVSEEVYTAYATAGRKMDYMEFDLKRDRVLQDAQGKAIRDENNQPIYLPEREVSLDKLFAEDWDFSSTEVTSEDTVLKQIEFAELRRYLALLDADEQKLIGALFFEGLTESAYSKKIGLTQKAVNKRKHRVLGKLKNLFSNAGT
jgi:RNA polymerase sigma factor (sigma-70 family)